MAVGLTVIIDQDGVIRNFNSAFNRKYNELAYDYNCRLVPEDYEPKHYRFAKDPMYCSKLADYIIGHYMEEIIADAIPYPDAYEFLETLKKMGFQLVTVTDAKFPQTVLDWLRRYKFTRYFKRVYFMGVARYKIGDILIDDKVDNLVEARLNGRIALALRRGWNSEWDGFRGSYRQIIGYLRSLLGE